MITTSDISKETGLSQRAIQKRVARLGTKVKRAGTVAVLSMSQAAQVKAMSAKPGRKVNKVAQIPAASSDLT
jgi:hypothetical protein